MSKIVIVVYKFIENPKSHGQKLEERLHSYICVQTGSYLRHLSWKALRRKSRDSFYVSLISQTE
jgi:hypothetical protein